MFDRAKLVLISDVDQDKYMFGSHERSRTYRGTRIISKVQTQIFFEKSLIRIKRWTQRLQRIWYIFEIL